MDKKRYLPEVLETERLILRPLTMNDKDAIYKWTSDPRVAKFMPYPVYKSPDDANPWLENIYLTDKELDYGFVLKETGELIGSGGILFHAEDDEWAIGYNLRYDQWGKGIATEVSKKIIEHATEKFHIKKLVAKVAVENTASIHVIEKLGLKYSCDYEYSKFDGSETFKAKKFEINF